MRVSAVRRADPTRPSPGLAPEVGTQPGQQGADPGHGVSTERCGTRRAVRARPAVPVVGADPTAGGAGRPAGGSPFSSNVAHASQMMMQLPGDVVFTGAPPGVGPIRAGDVLHTRIRGLGEMTVGVR